MTNLFKDIISGNSRKEVPMEEVEAKRERVREIFTEKCALDISQIKGWASVEKFVAEFLVSASLNSEIPIGGIEMKVYWNTHRRKKGLSCWAR